MDRSPSPPSCETRFPARNPSDTLTVVLFDTVDLSHAPWGRNREERFVFSHLYETLATIDCHGDVQPGLAKSWLEASDGWLITLRDDAQFWDETPVTSYDVVASFKTAIAPGIAIKSVDPIDERSFLVRGHDRRPDPKWFALQMLAVSKASGTAGPPIGTGPWLLDENVPVAEAIVMRPVLSESPVVRFIQGNVSDARDIMGGNADAMITDDPAAIEYARAKKILSLAPLAWDRVYILLSTSRAWELDNRVVIDDLPLSLCDGLARDAVRLDARGGSSLILDSASACDTRIEVYDHTGNAPGAVTSNRQVVFAVNDPTAQSLAERIVAVAAMDTAMSADARGLIRAVPDAGPGMRAMGLQEHEMESSVRAGDQFAYVCQLSWCEFPCEIWSFSAGATWLLANPPLSRRIVPLVETRAHFIAISDRIGCVDDHAGNVHILMPMTETRR